MATSDITSSAAVSDRPDARPDARPGARRTGVLASVGWPALGLVGVLVLWQAIVELFHPAAYLVPSPEAVVTTTWKARDTLISNGAVTVKEVLGGFAIATALAIPLGIIVVSNRYIERIFYPLIVLVNSLPQIALAPIFVVWLGYGYLPRIIITVLIAFFPILVNTAVGIKSTEPELLRMARSVGSKQSSIFLRIRLPHALPNIFAGLKVSATLAVIGAVVAEFVAATAGWGYQLILAQGQLKTALMFGIVIILAVFSVALYYIVALIERLLIPWHSSQRNDGWS